MDDGTHSVVFALQLCVSFLFGLGAFGESSKMLQLPESTTMQPHQVKGPWKWKKIQVSSQSPTDCSNLLRSPSQLSTETELSTGAQAVRPPFSPAQAHRQREQK